MATKHSMAQKGCFECRVNCDAAKAPCVAARTATRSCRRRGRLLSASAAHAGSLQNASTNAPKTPSAMSWSPVRGISSTTMRCQAVSPPKAAEIDFSLAVQVGGHDNLAECARFLVQIGIRPEDVDRILQEAVMHGADPAHIASPEGMAEQMRKLQQDHLQRAMRALEDLGIGRLEQLLLISRSPAILSPACDPPAVMEFLRKTLLLEPGKVNAIAAASPQVLTASLEGVIAPAWRSLTESFGQSPAEASAMVEQHPLILAEGELPGKAELLREFGVVPGDIAKEGGAELMTKPLKEWRRKAEFATDIMGVRREEVAAAASEFFAADFPTVILPRFDFIRDQGRDPAAFDLMDLVRGSDAEWCSGVMDCGLVDYVKFRGKPETLRNFVFMLQWYDN